MQNTKMRLKTDDKVQIIAGKDKGKIGKVMKVLRKKNKVIVENINIAKVHQRPSQANPQGGIVEKTMPVDYSNVMLMCSSCVKPSRVSMKTLESGKKVRICKQCNEQIDA